MKCPTCKRSPRNKCADCKLEICIHTGRTWGGAGWGDRLSVHLCRKCCKVRAAEWFKKRRLETQKNA